MTRDELVITSVAQESVCELDRNQVGVYLSCRRRKCNPMQTIVVSEHIGSILTSFELRSADPSDAACWPATHCVCVLFIANKPSIYDAHICCSRQETQTCFGRIGTTTVRHHAAGRKERACSKLHTWCPKLPKEGHFVLGHHHALPRPSSLPMLHRGVHRAIQGPKD